MWREEGGEMRRCRRTKERRRARAVREWWRHHWVIGSFSAQHPNSNTICFDKISKFRLSFSVLPILVLHRVTSLLTPHMFPCPPIYEVDNVIIDLPSMVSQPCNLFTIPALYRMDLVSYHIGAH